MSAVDTTSIVRVVTMQLADADGLAATFYLPGESPGLEVQGSSFWVLRVNPSEVTMHAPALRDMTVVVPIDLIYVTAHASGVDDLETVREQLEQASAYLLAPFDEWVSDPGGVGIVRVDMVEVAVGRGDQYGEELINEGAAMAAGHLAISVTAIQ